MKPIVNWVGGKSRDIKYISKYIPWHINTYIEPFVGGGSMFFHLNHSNNIINDNDTDLTNLYNNLANSKNQIIFENACNKFNSSSEIKKQEIFNNALTLLNTSTDYSLERSIAFYIYKTKVFRGILRYNKFGKYTNYKFNTHNKSIGILKLTISDNFYKLMEYTQIFNTEYKTIMNMGSENDFIFIDPPYDKTIGYKTQFTNEDHIQLSNLFKSSISKIMIVINDTPFIRQLYKDYIVDRYTKKYNIKNIVKSDDYHLVILNYNNDES